MRLRSLTRIKPGVKKEGLVEELEATDTGWKTRVGKHAWRMGTK